MEDINRLKLLLVEKKKTSKWLSEQLGITPNYVNSKHKVCIVCPKHGEFWQSPNAHLHGYGITANVIISSYWRFHIMNSKTLTEY